MNNTRISLILIGVLFLIFGTGMTIQQFNNINSGLFFLGLGFVIGVIGSLLPIQLCAGVPWKIIGVNQNESYWTTKTKNDVKRVHSFIKLLFLITLGTLLSNINAGFVVKQELFMILFKNVDVDTCLLSYLIVPSS